MNDKVSSARLHAQAQCDGKQKYDTFSDANAVLRHTRKHTVARASTHAYKCEFCGNYHIGTFLKMAKNANR